MTNISFFLINLEFPTIYQNLELNPISIHFDNLRVSFTIVTIFI